MSQETTASEYLENLIEKLYGKSGQKVVVLIDEYDKPLLDQLTDMKIAKANREILRDILYDFKSTR